MSKYFYKDIKLILLCKRCEVEYRPPRFSWQATLRLCWKCRRVWFKESYEKWGRKYDRTPARKKFHYEVWKRWVVKNIDKRRRQALASYHRRKHLHKKSSS